MHPVLSLPVKSLRKPLRLLALILPIFFLTAPAPLSASPAPASNRARIVILMVWDGLRPDSVTQRATPNLYALEHQGVYFAAHHSLYPSLTMVNAAGLATAAIPGANGILANAMYLAPLLGGGTTPAGAALVRARMMPVSLEDSQMLTALSGPGGLDGSLVALETIAQRLLHSGGFVGIVGKTGPTFLFDDQVCAPNHEAAANELFVSDDQVFPQSLAQQLGGGFSLAALKAALSRTPPLGEQDEHLAQVFIDHMLPAAAAALAANKSALLVLWQHNPDITEHAAGLGTAAFDRALAICDANLGRLRAALARLNIEDRTDLVIVSDHGFATIKVRVELADLLIAQGLKKSRTSDDVVVAHNFGSDEIYLSPRLDRAARSELMRKIVDYAAAQDWCGPIFSRAAVVQADRGYAGEIPGTFDQAWFGLLNPARSADLVISFRELPGQDNAKLTGPHAPALVLDGTGMHGEPNRSQPLLTPVLCVSYADSGQHATTGDGTHGALGECEMHNFGAATGPDFRLAYIDKAPSSNLDVARTSAQLLGLQVASAAQQLSGSGRLLKEALRNGARPAGYHRVPVSVTLNLPGQRIVTTIDLDRIDARRYPAAATVVHIPAAAKQAPLAISR